MIWLPLMDLPAQRPVLPDRGALVAMMLTLGTTVTLPLPGWLVIVTEVGSGLQLASHERSSTSSASTPDSAERVSLISWARALVAVKIAIAGTIARMTIPAAS